MGKVKIVLLDRLSSNLASSLKFIHFGFTFHFVKMEVSTAGVYTVTFQDGTVKKYNEDGTAA